MENIDDIIFRQPRKTFMEILRVNNREVPFANLLAFFFRPKEKHGLGTLFINALLNTKCSNFRDIELDNIESSVKNRGYNCENPFTELAFDIDSVSVKVEKQTHNGNKIDIIIEADEFVICIEFKINHELNNPLDDYYEYMSNKFEKKRHYFIVLTPFKKEPSGRATLFFKNNNKFKQVILSHFFQQVKQELQELPPHYTDKTNLYFQYFEDLVQTVENRKIRDMRYRAYNSLNLRLKKLKITSDFHGNNQGGFLEIKRQHFILKIRITSSGWQIEMWTESMTEEKEIIKLGKEINSDAILKELQEILEKEKKQEVN